jgi:hypothetical protein
VRHGGASNPGEQPPAVNPMAVNREGTSRQLKEPLARNCHQRGFENVSDPETTPFDAAEM